MTPEESRDMAAFVNSKEFILLPFDIIHLVFQNMDRFRSVDDIKVFIETQQQKIEQS